MTAPKHLRIGVFIPKTVQLLDLSPIDLFGMLDPTYLRACNLPAPLIALGTPSTIHYISLPSSGSHVTLTAGITVKVTATTEDKEVQPGNLDILLIPGPDPSEVFGEEVLEFVRRHVEYKTTDLLSVCTGCIVLAQAGVLKGKSACGPRAFTSTNRKNFPDTKWVDDKRWVKDGNIWSSGKFSFFHM
jgi:transcriptional regulator GlxA family with amidase domain